MNEFFPNYEKLPVDYTYKPDDEDYVFESEDEMISYFVDTPNTWQLFLWYKNKNNPDNLHVGAEITNDTQLIFILSFDSIFEKEAEYFLRLKRFLNSDIGVISYTIPAEYDNGEDFVRRYKDVKYEFE